MPELQPQEPQLTVDEAMAEFQSVLREFGIGEGSTSTNPFAGETREQAEERLFKFAQYVLSLACDGPKTCVDQRCRRNGLCQHIVDLQTRRRSAGQQPFSRRTPDAQAVRHAVWVYMNSGR